MTLSPDPGGVFASDAHRRVLGNLPLPSEDRISVVDFISRIEGDEQINLNVIEIVNILEELETSDYVSQDKTGFKQTTDGLAALSGPNQGDGA